MPRQRKLTDAQVADLLEWAKHRMPLKTKAASLGIGSTTAREIIAKGGYKARKSERRA